MNRSRVVKRFVVQTEFHLQLNREGWIKSWPSIAIIRHSNWKMQIWLSLWFLLSIDGVWGSASFEASVPHDLHRCHHWHRFFLILRLLRHSLSLHQPLFLVPFKYHPLLNSTLFHTLIRTHFFFVNFTPFILLLVNVTYPFVKFKCVVNLP